MASSGSRRRADARTLLPALLALAAGCATRPAAPVSAAVTGQPAVVSGEGSAAAAVHATPPVDAGIELPPGTGRDILLSACLACHDLGAIELFSSFYDREQWHELVLTMQANGAAVDAGQVETLSDYLAEHFGVTAN